jgi:hypothetical protein
MVISKMAMKGAYSLCDLEPVFGFVSILDFLRSINFGTGMRAEQRAQLKSGLP